MQKSRIEAFFDLINWATFFTGIWIGLALEATYHIAGEGVEKVTNKVAPKTVEFTLKTSSGVHKVQCLDNGKNSTCTLTGGNLPDLGE